MSDSRNSVVAKPDQSAVLIVNLGTPDAPTVPAVRRYLREFLSDPMVIDIAPLARWLFLNLVILPFRPKVSAAAYAKVWMDEGSPLLVYSRRFTAKLSAELGAGYDVELAMRYGQPSIASAMRRLKDRGHRKILLVPMYAQETASSTGSTLAEVKRVLLDEGMDGGLEIVPPFHGDEGYLASQAKVVAESLAGFEPDQVLFSYHGLPERHVTAEDQSGAHCLKAKDCCAQLDERNAHCYRAQCYSISRRVAGLLELKVPWTVAFQSRLGRTPWIQPFTDVVLNELPGKGARRVLVVSGSFVADCLETLEELGIRAKEEFLAAGGEELRLVPSLNDGDDWVLAAAEMIRRA
jgi:ferrochelatase